MIINTKSYQENDFMEIRGSFLTYQEEMIVMPSSKNKMY